MHCVRMMASIRCRLRPVRRCSVPPPVRCWPASIRPGLAGLGFRQLAEQTRARGIRIIGATLTPFEGALPDTPLDNYYHPDKDVLRRQLNDWIRHSGTFDAVTDFDAVLRDPQHPARMAPPFDSGDHLHPGDVGNRAMAGAVDLDALFADDASGAPCFS